MTDRRRVLKIEKSQYLSNGLTDRPKVGTVPNFAAIGQIVASF